MPLNNPTHEEQTWASKTAMRLRFVQADFADRPADERSGFIEDELEGALRELTAEQRPGYVRALAEHFPTAFVTGQETPDATPADNSPEALVEALVNIAPQLPKSLLAEFGLRLQQAGYMEIKSTTLMDAPPEEVLRLLPLLPGDCRIRSWLPLLCRLSENHACSSYPPRPAPDSKSGHTSCSRRAQSIKISRSQAGRSGERGCVFAVGILPSRLRKMAAECL